MTKQFQAYASKHGNRVAATPRQAAKDFFAHNPKARKCNVIQGVSDGIFFTVTYGRVSNGEWPESYKDVTRKTLDTLPDSLPVKTVVAETYTCSKAGGRIEYGYTFKYEGEDDTIEDMVLGEVDSTDTSVIEKSFDENKEIADRRAAQLQEKQA